MHNKVVGIIRKAVMFAASQGGDYLRSIAPMQHHARKMTPARAVEFLRAFHRHERAPWAGTLIALEKIGCEVLP